MRTVLELLTESSCQSISQPGVSTSFSTIIWENNHHGTKVKLFLGFLHFAEHDSPQDSFIFSYFVMLFSLVLPLASESSTSVVNVDVH